jgi:hypothetical protein
VLISSNKQTEKSLVSMQERLRERGMNLLVGQWGDSVSLNCIVC